jgi:GntR family transcriptional repressor for pyruvate dehydrogenase complex
MDAVGTGAAGTESSGADALGTEGLTVDDFLALDVRFHLAVADAAGNAVVSAMMGSLRESIQGYAAQLTANLPDWDATASRLRAEHRGILAAIRDDDGERAAKLVAAHIEGYYREAGVRQG